MSRDDLPEAVTEWARQQPGYDRLARYYRGRHEFPFASWKFRQRYTWITERARMNLMPATVAAFTDRISIDSWTNADAIKDADINGLTRLAAAVHRGCWRDGDAFTITSQLPSGQIRAVIQRPGSIVPHVDPDNPDVLDHATKIWVDKQTRHARAAIYWPDRIERFISRLPLHDGSGHSLRDMPDKMIAWMPVPDEPVQPHNFGAVPVVWWKRDADTQTDKGVSILDQVIQTQDELNYYVASTIIASERISMPIRYALADAAPPTTTGVTFDPTRESILALVAKTAGEFPGPDADKLLALRAAAQQDICLAVGIPPYVFARDPGDIPSGLSLRIVNESRTSAVTAFEADATPCWRGQMALLGHADTQPQWGDPTPADSTEQLARAQAERDMGLPPEVWLRTAGYDPAAVDESGVSLADRVRVEATTSATRMAQAFMDGQGAASYAG